ncbi:MAG: contractile injection system tape measure protein, partial [Chitinophagaceae bacterium]
LCGFHLEDPFLPGTRLTKAEMSEADNLIESVIENWKVLKKTSIAGFRESFFQRKGILQEKDAHWILQVEKKGYDIVLNTIPWGFSLIKLPWMTKHIQVEW